MNWILEVATVLFLAAAAWLRAAGSAVAELPRADAHHDSAARVRGSRTVARLLGDRSRIQPAVGMVGTALLVAAAVAGFAVVERREGVSLAVGVAGVAAVVILLGDVAPRLLGRRRPRFVAYRSAPLLTAAVALGGWAAERPVDDNGNGNGEEAAEIDDEERALISSVLRFSGTIVREVMVPRGDMVTVAVDADAETLAAAAIEHGYSRFPVVSGEEVVGVFLVKDLLPGLAGDAGAVRADALMREPAFVPEVKQIADLLADMRASKTHMAIVVDEFGEIAGLVTIEDLLEELVGEIADETDEDEIWVEPLGQRTWKVDARLSVEALAGLIDLDLPDGDWDTVAGLVLGLAERVPEEAERFDVEQATLTVARMQGRRVAEVIVTDGRSPMSGERS